MPKTVTAQQADCNTVKSILKEFMGRSLMGIPELAKRSGMSTQTLYKRFREPDSFRRGELKAICNVLKIPAERRKELL